MKTNAQPKRIGIYAGTFNPVHSGHIAFALQALQAAKLDRLYFLPERQPRYKTGVEHFAHRVAMLQRAVRPHPRFGVLELPDTHFSVNRTLPKLQYQCADNQLVFLFGSDVLPELIHWPYAGRLLQTSELIIGLRHGDDRQILQRQLADWPFQPRACLFVNSYAPHVSSGMVREALRHGGSTRGLLASVQQYCARNWLYHKPFSDIFTSEQPV